MGQQNATFVASAACVTSIAEKDPQEEMDELCRTCRKIDFRAPPGACKVHYVGMLPKIFENRRCPLCRFITSEFRVAWEREGYTYENRFAVNKRVAVGETFYTPSGFDHMRRNQPEIMTFLPSNIPGRKPGEELSFISSAPMIVSEILPPGETSAYPANGRLGTEYLRINVLNDWFRKCDEEHFPLELSSARLKVLPAQLRVVDAIEGNLTLLPPGGRYMAMSYVWGPAKFLTLRLANKAELEKPGALFTHPDMAAVMKSGMQFVASLGEGFRYLWIDALCILQDPGNPEMALLIPRMDIIYNNAYATIVAPEGTQAATYGLPGVKDSPRPVLQKTVSGLIGNIRVAQIDDAAHSFDSMLNKCTWSTRGWTFQERLLSHRSVYLCKEQMFFECSKGCVHAETWVNKSPLKSQTNLCYRLHNVDDAEALIDEDITSGCPKLRLFDDILTAYSRRNLTQGKDILNAMNGIMAQWKSAINMSFTNGLPYLKYDDLGLSLLWYPLKLRGRRFFTREGHSYCPFPSWSWCGLMGTFAYPEYILRRDPGSFVQDYQLLKIIPGSKHEFDTNETKGWGDRILSGDQLCIKAHSAIFYLSSNPILYDAAHHHRCVYDADGVHCGVTMAFNLKLDRPTQRVPCEAVRLFSKGGDWTEYMRDYSKEKNTNQLKFLKRDTDGEDSDEEDSDRSHVHEESDDENDPDAECGLFDGKAYKQSPDCLVQVMFIGRYGDLAERCGIGLIHEDAFKKAKSTEKQCKIV